MTGIFLNLCFACRSPWEPPSPVLDPTVVLQTTKIKYQRQIAELKDLSGVVSLKKDAKTVAAPRRQLVQWQWLRREGCSMGVALPGGSWSSPSSLRPDRGLAGPLQGGIAPP